MNMLGLNPGEVTPLGLLNNQESNVIFYLDEEFDNRIGVHPNDNSATIYLKVEDLLEIIKKHENIIYRVRID